jgi:hypothetical protein
MPRASIRQLAIDEADQFLERIFSRTCMWFNLWMFGVVRNFIRKSSIDLFRSTRQRLWLILYMQDLSLVSLILECRQQLETRYLRSRHRVVVTRQSLPKLTKDPDWAEWVPQLHISKDSFRELVYLIQDNPVFSNNSPCKQLDVWDQLVVFLRFMVLPAVPTQHWLETWALALGPYRTL